MRIIIMCCLLFICKGFSQEDLAKEYFKNGEFNKAQITYERLLKEQPEKIDYVLSLTEIYQQLERYSLADSLLSVYIQKLQYPALYVDLGYNRALMGDSIQAEQNYEIALQSLDANVSHVYTVASRFEIHSLLNYAEKAYKKVMVTRPDLDFSLQLAKIYGEQGRIEDMFGSYINFLQTNPHYINNIKRYISDFIKNESVNENNQILRKILLVKSQENPDIIWNNMLSWLFIQQGDYNKAFIQEKAIYNRNPESLKQIFDLAHIAADAKQTDIASDIFKYIIETAQDTPSILEAHYQLIQMAVKLTDPSIYKDIEANYQKLFSTYGITPETLKLQISYAHFLAFNKNDIHKANLFLKESLKLPLSEYQQALVKLELADILVLEEKFNEALIYYSQIQHAIKNSTLAQTARFKVAQTSYFKGDFSWAEAQLKVLKMSTSQLIANDALDLFLLITDNKFADSTQAALKSYAKADFLAFQNKTDTAIALLETIKETYKTKPIEDQALFKQAQLFEIKKQYRQAEANYLSIITDFKDDFLADDAYYALATLYSTYLDSPDQAKNMYEQIIFNYPNSIYLIEAQKKFRALRNATLN